LRGWPVFLAGLLNAAMRDGDRIIRVVRVGGGGRGIHCRKCRRRPCGQGVGGPRAFVRRCGCARPAAVSTGRWLGRRCGWRRFRLFDDKPGVHHSFEGEHVHALRSRERGCFLVAQTLWAEKIQSTIDAGSLNTFGRNEIEVAPISSALFRIACLVILYKILHVLRNFRHTNMACQSKRTSRGKIPSHRTGGLRRNSGGGSRTGSAASAECKCASSVCLSYNASNLRMNSALSCYHTTLPTCG